jgi:pSer/pThr/pTyr-binding forkhead associated (FHA) protein
VIVCRNCNQSNLDGALFCADCGSALTAAEDPTTQSTSGAGIGRKAESAAEAPHRVAPLQDNWVTLHLLDTGEMLPLAERNEFTLGRGSDTQPIMPDIDLSPYRAYASGVSRLHAVIRRGISQIVLTDLESANGTFVNGKRIKPNEEQALAHGDVIALGKLKIQILLKAP